MPGFKELLRRLVLGTAHRQEYLTVEERPGVILAHAFVGASDHDEPLDVTGQHLFLGYAPLIIGLPANLPEAAKLRLTLAFAATPGPIVRRWGERVPADSGGWVRLEACGELPGVRLFRGVAADSQLLPRRLRWAHGAEVLRQRLKARRGGRGADPLALAGDAYVQVRLAYALPRPIQVLCVVDGDKGNVFPTDLHGPLGSDQYLVSLRRGGLAAAQFAEVPSITLARVGAEQASAVYALGKNHMRPLRPIDELALELEPGQIDVPRGGLSVRSLRPLRHLDLGVHRIFLCAAGAPRQLREGAGLAHLHLHGALWRDRRGLVTPYVAR